MEWREERESEREEWKWSGAAAAVSSKKQEKAQRESYDGSVVPGFSAISTMTSDHPPNGRPLVKLQMSPVDLEEY